MNKLDRYVFRELMVPFLIGTLAVVLMFQANLLIFQLKTFSLSAVPLTAMLQLILYKTPEYLTLTLPVGTSLAASLAVSRLARESELAAMRAAGAPILRVVAPIGLFGLLVALGNYLVAEEVMPSAERQANKLFVQVGFLGQIPDFKSNVLVNLRNQSASFGTVTRNRDGSLSLSDILLIERPRLGVAQITTAESGRYQDGIWTLHNTYVTRMEGPRVVTAQPGEDVVINERITVDSVFTEPLPQAESARNLLVQIKERKATGYDTTMLEVNYHTRFSVPASCLVFALVSPVFAIWFARSGGFMGVLLSIILVFLYYNGYVISTTILGRNGIVGPVWAAWLPNVLFLALGAIAMRRLE